MQIVRTGETDHRQGDVSVMLQKVMKALDPQKYNSARRAEYAMWKARQVAKNPDAFRERRRQQSRKSATKRANRPSTVVYEVVARESVAICVTCGEESSRRSNGMCVKCYNAARYASNPKYWADRYSKKRDEIRPKMRAYSRRRLAEQRIKVAIKALNKR
jgi:hypothetical protein